jgi:hypothetical protein
MGIKITTDSRGIKVWRFERDNGKASYAVQISKREGDGWINHYQPVRFRQGIDVPNGTLIHIKNAFPTLDTWTKDGQEFKREVWQIMEFSSETMNDAQTSPQMQMDVDDLPDSFSAAEDDIPF